MSKLVSLEVLKTEVASCQKCPELVKSRTQTVFGEGNPDADLMFIAEAPGFTEDQRGVPFVGDSGELLDNILKACQIDRKSVYIANVVKCRPPGNRNPTEEECGNCRDFLDRQIEVVKPKIIMLLGSVASKNVLNGYVSSLRGRWHSYKGIHALVTFHPSYLLRTPAAKKDAGKDFRMLVDRLKLINKS